ncbi:MAG: uridine kinase [Cellulomonas sp.]|nr:uridine kinase [Cellulomonas sp.]
MERSEHERARSAARAGAASDAPDGDPAGLARSVGVVVERSLAGRARLGRVRLVCVDGPAGSGKTTFAAALVTAFESALSGRVPPGDAADPPVRLVHLDDLYEGWTGLEGSLWPRLEAQVLDPLRRGLEGRYQRYDWTTARFAEWAPVAVPQVLVIEGCGSARRACDRSATTRVWVEAAPELRLSRGLARDGQGARAHWLAWMADEAAHFAEQDTRRSADVRLDAWGTMPT